MIDPYSATDTALLKNAASISCSHNSGADKETPFCNDTNGILLHVQWCSYELYHGPAPSPPATCHYTVSAVAGNNNPNAPEVANPDIISPCSTTYDTCAQSQLMTVLGAINTINAHRAAAGLTPLNISIDLLAGALTPLAYLFNAPTGTLDLPAAAGSNSLCVRVPDIWLPSYAQNFRAALDSLVGTIAGALGSSAQITILKLAAANTVTGEYDQDGVFTHENAPVDNASVPIENEGIIIKCPLSTGTPNNGASLWLNLYNADHTNSPTNCLQYASMEQGTECVFGVLAGYEAAILAKYGFNNAILSVATNGSQALPQVDCGQYGVQTCLAQSVANSTNMDQWSVYYFYRQLYDLFAANSVVNKSANAAWTDAGETGTFPLQAAQLAVTWTGLTLNPTTPTGNFFEQAAGTQTNSIDQLGCALNNDSANNANEPTFKLNNAPVTDNPGVPDTVVSWQTQTNQGVVIVNGQPQFEYCQTPAGDGNSDYYHILQSGAQNGGSFLEVQSDVAFPSDTSIYFTGDLPDCGPALASWTGTLTALTTVGLCNYHVAQ